MAFIIGLTGNIATGKSSVTAILRELGAEVVDSDQLVHRLYAPGSPVVKQIAHVFGPHVMNSDGSIDRSALSRIVFSHPDNLRRLEEIVWPAVGELRDEHLRNSTAPVVVVDAVKLIEAGFHAHCNSVWLVTADPDTQISRLIRDRGMTQEQATQRLAAQSPVAPKIAVADVVLENNGSLEDLRRQVFSAWERICHGEHGVTEKS